MDIKHGSGNIEANEILKWAYEHGLETSFQRASKIKQCPIGSSGACCRACNVGPCRLVGKKDEEELTGVCGANLPTVVSRNFLRMIAGGTAAHSDHARDMVLTLLAVARKETKDFEIKDVKKLFRVAGILDINYEGRAIHDVAHDVAMMFLQDFQRQNGELNYIKRAPKPTQERWRKWGIIPRNIDREVCEAMHRTSVGVDHEPENLLMHGLRTALADGWGGSMISTDVTDILFGTPYPMKAEASFGIFKEDEVNLVVHGHEPTLSEKIVEVVEEKEMIEYAKSKGAKGINLGGMCCTANEILMRHGIPTAGGFTNQEIGILTGIIDAITVDVQCIMPAIVELSKRFHTKIITTSAKGKMAGAIHIQYDEHRAKEIARQIVRIACDNYVNRKTKGSHITKKYPMIGGFSHEYIEYMQGGKFRASFRPLNDAIISGRIRGVVGLAGCDNPRVQSTGLHKHIALELIKNDVLIVSTGCGSAACGTAGYLIPEMALESAGPGLREVCEAIGIPPILHLGACVDNSRILTILSAMAEEGGLSNEIGGMPGVGIAPEWMSEKAIAIGCYFVASGVPVVFGGESPVGASKEVAKLLTDVCFERFKGAFHFEPDPDKMISLTLMYIDMARDALKLRRYEKGKYATDRILMDMAARREIERAAKPHIGF
ncbi:MAG: anaerobic carbon-monoxide dehydrogenase catalytic subunit [Thermodesulfovibrionales bacterium]|nr:anaerobic carbon-monoxide dehydrogenase catalytic subunit [Thermodesulfovibrionales bacterium]